MKRLDAQPLLLAIDREWELDWQGSLLAKIRFNLWKSPSPYTVRGSKVGHDCLQFNVVDW